MSVDDAPVSLEVAKSTRDGVIGADESMDTSSDEPADETFPAASVNVPEIVHVPSVSAGRSHDVAEPTVKMQVVVVVPFVAVTVAVSPAFPPASETAGVVSFVASSVSDVPVSDDTSRSGAPGADGAVVSRVRLRAVVAVPALPAGSVTDAEMDHVPSAIRGRSQEESVPTV